MRVFDEDLQRGQHLGIEPPERGIEPPVIGRTRQAQNGRHVDIERAHVSERAFEVDDGDDLAAPTRENGNQRGLRPAETQLLQQGAMR